MAILDQMVNYDIDYSMLNLYYFPYGPKGLKE
jgi:hypothetical protein